MSGHQYKKFGNMVYAYNGDYYHSKTQAKIRAKQLRSDGFFVRILKDGDVYSIFTRRKDR